MSQSVRTVPDMPLTALFDKRPVDLLDQFDDPFWSKLRAYDHSPIICRDCGGSMHARAHHTTAFRYFQHNPGQLNDDCPSSGETYAHLQMKATLAAAISALGWTATVEATGDGWRADVLADLHGRRVALEAQLSGQSAAAARMRTDRYARDGIDVFWFTHSDVAGWGQAVGWTTVRKGRAVGPMLTREFARRPTDLPRPGRTSTAPLPDHLAALLGGELRWYDPGIAKMCGWIAVDEYEHWSHLLAARTAEDRQLGARRQVDLRQLREETIQAAGYERMIDIERRRAVRRIMAQRSTTEDPIVEALDGGTELADATILLTLSGQPVLVCPHPARITPEAVDLFDQALDIVVPELFAEETDMATNAARRGSE